MLALVRNVLRHFGQEVQDAEDLKITLRSASQVAAGRTGKAAAVIPFRSIDHRTVVGQTHDARFEVSLFHNREAMTADSLGRQPKENKVKAIVSREAAAADRARCIAVAASRLRILFVSKTLGSRPRLSAVATSVAKTRNFKRRAPG